MILRISILAAFLAIAAGTIAGLRQDPESRPKPVAKAVAGVPSGPVSNPLRGNLAISCDVGCESRLMGQTLLVLNGGVAQSLPLTAGSHLVTAVGLNGEGPVKGIAAVRPGIGAQAGTLAMAGPRTADIGND